MRALLIAVAVLLLTACSVFNKINVDNASTRFIVQYAALKYVEGSTGIDTERAARVYGHVKAVRGYLEASAQVSVGDLEQYIISRVDWSDLSPADTMAARAFITYLAAELNSRLEVDQEIDRLVVARDLVDLVAYTLEPYL